MARGARPERYDVLPNFIGGLNTVSAEVAMGETQVRAATNARITQFGAVQKRGGTKVMSNPAQFVDAAMTGLTQWELSNGTRYVVAGNNGALYTALYANMNTAFDVVPSSAVTVGARLSFADFRDSTQDMLFVADGGALNGIYIGGAPPNPAWSGDIASTPNVADLEAFNQRLWGCGNATYPQAIFYSAENDGTTLGIGASGGGQINVRTFGQQNVVAVKALGTSLMIFHRGGVSRLTGFGQDDTQVLPAGVTGEVGTTARDSIVQVGNVLYYVNVRGLFVATPDGVMPVSTPEKPDPLTAILPSLTEAQLEGVVCAFSRPTNELLISIPSVGVYTYHVVVQAWAGPWVGTYQTTDTQLLAEVGDSANAPVVLKGSPAGTIELVDASGSTTDSATFNGTAGTPFTMTVTCRRFFFGDSAEVKSFRYAYLVADLQGSPNVDLAWTTSDSNGGSYTLVQSGAENLTTETDEDLTTETDEPLAVTAPANSIRCPLWGTGYYADLTFTHADTDALPSISRVEAMGFGLGRRE